METVLFVYQVKDIGNIVMNFNQPQQETNGNCWAGNKLLGGSWWFRLIVIQ